MLDLHRYQLTEQHQLLNHLQITRVEAKNKEKWKRDKYSNKEQYNSWKYYLQAEKRVHIVQINQIMEEQKNKDANAFDYEGQQNRDGNGDLNVDRNIQENILRVVSNKFHLLLINKF